MKPKFLYINPVGGNPAGTNLSASRRREIYSICSEHDILILEDDPYFYLHFSSEPMQSFLSIDVDGRVIRFDSFSKILSSGIRVGFTTGPKELLRPIMMHMQVRVKEL